MLKPTVDCKPDSGSQVFLFGKYFGETYASVYAKDRKYHFYLMNLIRAHNESMDGITDTVPSFISDMLCYVKWAKCQSSVQYNSKKAIPSTLPM